MIIEDSDGFCNACALPRPARNCVSVRETCTNRLDLLRFRHEVVAGFPQGKIVRTRKHTKLVREGGYVAEVEVHLIESKDNWTAYLSLEDTYKLDDVREALRRGDIEAAAKFGRIYALKLLAG
jgi:hypothetical protein